MPQRDGPARTRAGRLNELFAGWVSNSTRGAAFAHWLSTKMAAPQLRRLAGGDIPWVPVHKPLSEAVVVLVSTAGRTIEPTRFATSTWCSRSSACVNWKERVSSEVWPTSTTESASWEAPGS